MQSGLPVGVSIIAYEDRMVSHYPPRCPDVPLPTTLEPPLLLPKCAPPQCLPCCAFHARTARSFSLLLAPSRSFPLLCALRCPTSRGSSFAN